MQSVCACGGAPVNGALAPPSLVPPPSFVPPPSLVKVSVQVEPDTTTVKELPGVVEEPQ